MEEALNFDGVVGEHPLGEVVEEGLDLSEGGEEVLALYGFTLCLRDGVAQVFYFVVYVFDFVLRFFEGVEFRFVGVLDALALAVEFGFDFSLTPSPSPAGRGERVGRGESLESLLDGGGEEALEFVIVDEGLAAVEAGVAGLFSAEAVVAVGAGE